MESYLMMLYVTLEQESALKNFFVDQGWRFCKPDLSVTTDTLGPSIKDVQTDGSYSESNTKLVPSRLGKRKRQPKLHLAPVVKLAKVIPASASTTTSEQTFDNILGGSEDSEKLDELHEAELQDIADLKGLSDVPFKADNPKVKVETFDVSLNDDFDNDDDEDTDVDYNYDETKGEMEANVAEDNEDNEVGDTDEAVTGEATRARKPNENPKKNATVIKVKEESLPKCITCKHFEKQASILDKGPGIPDKDADEPNVYICDICGKQFIHQSTYKSHVRSHELITKAKSERERKWNCNYCEKVFGSEGNLKEHVGQVHLRKPGEFMCHLCPKSFTRSTRLEGHLNSHYGIKPYSCKSCHTTFHGKSSMIEHQKRCEGGMTVRFKCQFCLEYFGSQNERRQHRKQEHDNVFSFSPCGKKIRWKSSLKKHTETCVKCKDIEIANCIISGT